MVNSAQRTILLGACMALVWGCATTRPRVVSVAAVVPPPVQTTPIVREEPPPPPETPPVSPFAALPGWNDDSMAEVLPAWRRTCERLRRMPEHRTIGREGTVADWREACAELPPEGADHSAARAYFEQWFVPTLLRGESNEQGLFTGYYEPLLRGSRRRHGRFTVPLYARPRDLVSGGRMVRGRVRPYWTRAQIAEGSLRRSATPLVWVDDRVDAFFLEIQGSGRVQLEDGSTMFLNYAASNGHSYIPIGRVLIERGAMERSAVSLQSIRAWLLSHPNEAQSVMNRNPSYVFFRETTDGGAHGAEGVILTAGRSLAVDPHYVPLGTLLFLDVAPLEGVGPIRRLVVAQDTGGAIRGAVRGDLFWGAGPEAYDRAGRMRQSGRYWMLVPRSVSERRNAATSASVVRENSPATGVSLSAR